MTLLDDLVTRRTQLVEDRAREKTASSKPPVPRRWRR